MLVRYRNSGVFSVGSNFSTYGNFSLHFPTMASEKACCRLIVNFVGIRDYGVGKINGWRCGMYGAFGVHDALGVHDA